MTNNAPLHKAIVRGVGANTVAQLVVALSQLVSVPIYLAYWGPSLYGEWLGLFTLPAYISLCDLGFATAAGNDMTLAVAQEDRAGAARTFQSLRLGVGVVSIIVLLFSSLILYFIPSERLPGIELASPHDVRVTVILLICYALAIVHCSAALAGFRCAGMYPQGVMISTAITACEVCVSMAAVMLGGGLVSNAAAFASVRIIAVPLLFRILHRRAGWLMALPARPDLNEFRRLGRPALATMAIPVGTAITMQGTVLVIANGQPPAVVALFTTTRTLARLVLQLAATVSNAVMPEFTRVVGRNEIGKATSLFVANLIVATMIVVPLVLILSVKGADIVQIWTSGKIIPPEDLMLGLAAVVGFHTMWHFAMNLLLAVNRHQQAAWQYPAVALVGVISGTFAMRQFGLNGIVVTGLCVELWMLAAVWHCYNRFMPLDVAKLAAAVRALKIKSITW